MLGVNHSTEWLTTIWKGLTVGLGEPSRWRPAMGDIHQALGWSAKSYWALAGVGNVGQLSGNNIECRELIVGIHGVPEHGEGAQSL